MEPGPENFTLVDSNTSLLTNQIPVLKLAYNASNYKDFDTAGPEQIENHEQNGNFNPENDKNKDFTLENTGQILNDISNNKVSENIDLNTEDVSKDITKRKGNKRKRHVVDLDKDNKVDILKEAQGNDVTAAFSDREKNQGLKSSDTLSENDGTEIRYIVKTNCQGGAGPINYATKHTNIISPHLQTNELPGDSLNTFVDNSDLSKLKGEAGDILTNEINQYFDSYNKVWTGKGYEARDKGGLVSNGMGNGPKDVKEQNAHPVAMMMTGRKPLAYNPVDYGNVNVVKNEMNVVVFFVVQ